MDQAVVIQLAREAMLVALLLAAAPLGFGLAVGLGLSILQATTQIQEQTLTFVPKIIAVFLALAFFGSWMLNNLTAFTVNLFQSLPDLVR